MWIKTEDRLPEEGKYVLARHSRGTWIDRQDQENVNCVVVKLRRGITLAEREALRNGAPLPGAKGWGGDAPRWAIHRSEDEGGNNEKPYCWDQFGPDCFFGQDIVAWMPIEPLVEPESTGKEPRKDIEIIFGANYDVFKAPPNYGKPELTVSADGSVIRTLRCEDGTMPNVVIISTERKTEFIDGVFHLPSDEFPPQT